MPTAEHLRLLENIQEQGRSSPEDLDQVFRERFHVVGVQDQIVRDPDGSRDRLAGGDAEGLAPLQVSLREGMDFLRDGLGQDAYSETEFRIDLATRLDLQLAFVELEEPRPLDHVSLGELAETAKVFASTTLLWYLITPRACWETIRFSS